MPDYSPNKLVSKWRVPCNMYPSNNNSGGIAQNIQAKAILERYTLVLPGIEPVVSSNDHG